MSREADLEKVENCPQAENSQLQRRQIWTKLLHMKSSIVKLDILNTYFRRIFDKIS